MLVVNVGNLSNGTNTIGGIMAMVDHNMANSVVISIGVSPGLSVSLVLMMLVSISCNNNSANMLIVNGIGALAVHCCSMIMSMMHVVVLNVNNSPVLLSPPDGINNDIMSVVHKVCAVLWDVGLALENLFR